MGASPTICSRNTNVITVWAWMLWQPYALGTRTLSCFGHGRIANRMLLEHERYHGLGMHALATVCSRNTNVIMLWAWAHRHPYALGTRTLSCFGHGRIANRMLSEHERYPAEGMGASPTVCSRNTNVFMLWAWAHRQPYALGTRTGIMLWAWAHRQPYALGTRTLSCFGHGRTGNPVLLEHERYHGLGMAALASACSSCLLCPDPDKMPSSGRCFHIRSQVHVAATRSRCQPRAPHGVASLCQAGADRLTFRNVRFIRGHSWRTYLVFADGHLVAQILLQRLVANSATG